VSSLSLTLSFSISIPVPSFFLFFQAGNSAHEYVYICVGNDIVINIPSLYTLFYHLFAHTLSLPPSLSSNYHERYGPEFTGMDRFVAIHANEATGDVYCDRWHEGSGFLAHHLALSTSFEMSLQSIDKRVTTPYWDFTIDGEEIYHDGLGPKVLSERSPMFTELW
jgi:hypothetical protein